MDAAKAKRTSAKARFTTYEKRVLSLLETDDIDSWTLNNRYDDLKMRWERVQEAHDDYTSHMTEEDDITAEEPWLDELCGRFDAVEIAVGRTMKKDNAKTEPQSLMDVHTHLSQETVASVAGTGAAPMNNIRIERLRFSTFEGNIKKYPQFKEEFIKQVQPQCNRSQLAFVLKSYLSLPVQEEVSHVTDDYDKMWERLDQKYGNISKLVDTILYDVKQLSITEPTDSNVLQMINVVEKANRDLERLGEEAELRNSTSISIIEQAMTKEMRHEWVKIVASKSLSSSQRFNALLTFLQDWRNRLEYMGASIREPADDQTGRVDYKSGRTYHAGENTGYSNREDSHLQRRKQLSRCWLHNIEGEEGNHPIWTCRSFLAKNPTERRVLVTANRACMRCLIKTCAGAKDVSKCGRSFFCPVSGCQGTHNRLLHVDTSGVSLHANEPGTGATNDAILPTQAL